MSAVRALLARLRDFAVRRRLETELRDELRFHRASLERDARAAGATPASAARAAAMALGNETAIRESARSFWSLGWLESVTKDARFAVRSYRRAPAFTAIILLTLALGIGATTAVFSAVDGVLIRRLPFPDPSRLVAIWPGHTVSAAEYEYLRAHATSYDGGAAIFSSGWGSVINLPDAGLQVSGARTSVNFFRVLGAMPAIGRTFGEDEFTPARAGVVLLSWNLWTTRFGGDSAVVGRTVGIDGAPAQIIGVMPRGFSIYQQDAELWMPLPIDPSSSFYKGATAMAVGRLRRDVTQDAALRELRALVPAMRAEYAFENAYGNDVDMAGLQDTIVGPIRTTLLVLFGAVGFLLLIASANVANLLIARAGVRRDEFALRTALGASRTRVVRQLLVESVLLALCGGALGMAVGMLGVRALKDMLPPGLPRADAIAVDLRVLLITCAVTVSVGIAFGLLPALAASRDGGLDRAARVRGGGLLGRRARGALVVAEVALALVLVVGAGLMCETMWRLAHVDIGFRADHVVTLRVQPSGSDFPTTASRLAYFDDVMAAVRSVPGVEAAGAIQHLPLSGFDWHRDMEVEGHPQAQGDTPFRPGFRMILDDYFDAMRIPVVAGRAFTRADDTTHDEVAIINETFAKTKFPGEDPLGKRIRAQRFGWATIVGVVHDVRHVAVATPPEPEFFVPIRQHLQTQLQFVARTQGDPMASARTIYERVAAVRRSVPVTNLRTLDSHAAASIAQPRVVMALMLSFALVGLALGAIGIYGVVGYAVANRRKEIGIRVALGARRSALLALLLREGLFNASIGVAIGLVAAIAMSRAMQSLVFEVDPRDATTYAVVAVALLFVALLASWLPARKAANADPMRALRAD